MSRVVEINDARRLRELHLAWRLLLPQTPGASFFHTLDWLQASLRDDPDLLRLRVLAVYDAATPIGILPLVLRRRTTPFGVQRVLSSPVAPTATAGGPIGRQITATLICVLRRLQSAARDWEVLELCGVRSAGYDNGRIETALRLTGMSFQRSEMKVGRLIDLQSDPGSSSIFPRGCENERFRFQRIRGSAASGVSSASDLLDACLALDAVDDHRAAPGFPVSGSVAARRRLLQRVDRAASKSESLDVALLYSGSRLLACSYNVVWDRRVQCLHVACDQRFTKFAPLTLLWNHLLEDSRRRGDRQVELGAWSGRLPALDSSNSLTAVRYRHCRSVTRAALLRLSDWFDRRDTARGADAEIRVQ